MNTGALQYCDKDLRIRNWIESVLETSTSNDEPPVKRTRRGGDGYTTESFKLPYNAIIPDTPPPTDVSDTAGGRKRGPGGNTVDDAIGTRADVHLLALC